MIPVPTVRIPVGEPVALVSVMPSAARLHKVTTHRGTVVSYTGTLLVDGAPVRSPGQLLAEWSSAARTMERAAARVETRDPVAFHAARGEFSAYASGVATLDGVYAPWRDLDAAGVTVVHVRLHLAAEMLRELATDVETADQAGLTYVQLGAVRSSVRVLNSMAADLVCAARFEWLADGRALRGR